MNERTIDIGKAAERAMSSYLAYKLAEVEAHLFDQWKLTDDPQMLNAIKSYQSGIDALRAAIQADIDAGKMAERELNRENK